MTVRARLTLWFGGLLVLIVITFAVASYIYVRRLEYERLDRTLHEQSEIVLQSVQSIIADRGAFDAPGDAQLLRTLHDLRARGIRAWIFDDAGALRVSTGQVEEGEGPDEERDVLGDTLSLELLREKARGQAPSIAEVPAGAGRARLLSVKLPRAAGPGMLLVSYSLRDVASLLARARRDAAIAIVVALIAALAAGSFSRAAAWRPSLR